MKEYKDVLLIEYLMFSTDIKKDIKNHNYKIYFLNE